MRTHFLKKHFETPCRKPHHRRLDNNVYVVKILLSEVEYEVLQTMYKYGQMQGIKGEATEGLTLQDEERDWLDMLFKQAVDEVKSKLKPYLFEGSRMASDELIESPDEHDIILRHGEGWLGHPEQMANGIHSYIVAYIVAKWWHSGGDHTQAMIYEKTADDWLRKVYGEANAYDIEPIKMDIL